MDGQSDLATILPALSILSSSGTSSQPELGFHQGVVVSWNSLTNENRVFIAGTEFVNIPTLVSSDSILLRPGDIVGVLRFRSTYFILGRIALPNTNRTTDLQVSSVGNNESTTSTTPTNLTTFGPEIGSLYVGSARRVIIFASAYITVQNQVESGDFQVSVTGASIIPFTTPGTLFQDVTNPGEVIQANITAIDLVDASDGLNEGFNTFTMKYSSGLGNSVEFASRRLIVWAF